MGAGGRVFTANNSTEDGSRKARPSLNERSFRSFSRLLRSGESGDCGDCGDCGECGGRVHDFQCFAGDKSGPDWPQLAGVAGKYGAGATTTRPQYMFGENELRWSPNLDRPFLLRGQTFNRN
jgi:hypothetical protein